MIANKVECLRRAEKLFREKPDYEAGNYYGLCSYFKNKCYMSDEEVKELLGSKYNRDAYTFGLRVSQADLWEVGDITKYARADWCKAKIKELEENKESKYIIVDIAYDNKTYYKDSWAKCKIFSANKKNFFDKCLTTIEQIDGVERTKIKPTQIYRDIDDEPILTGVCFRVKDYVNGKRVYFDAWVTIYKVDYLNEADIFKSRKRK